MDDLSRPYTCIFQKFSMAFPSSLPTQKKEGEGGDFARSAPLGAKILHMAFLHS